MKRAIIVIGLSHSHVRAIINLRRNKPVRLVPLIEDAVLDAWNMWYGEEG